MRFRVTPLITLLSYSSTISGLNFASCCHSAAGTMRPRRRNSNGTLGNRDGCLEAEPAKTASRPIWASRPGCRSSGRGDGGPRVTPKPCRCLESLRSCFLQHNTCRTMVKNARNKPYWMDMEFAPGELVPCALSLCSQVPLVLKSALFEQSMRV